MQGMCKIQNSLDYNFIHRCMILGKEKHSLEVVEVKKGYELQSDLAVLGSTHYNSHIFVIVKRT